MKVLTRLAVAVVMVSTALLSAPTAAQADVAPAARTQVAQACTPTAVNSPSTGTAHAQLRQCSVVFVSSGTTDQQGGTITFQMRDSATDGVCAQALIDFDYVTYDKTTTKTECNGVWTDYSYSIIDANYAAYINVTLSYGGHSPVRAIDKNPFIPLP